MINGIMRCYLPDVSLPAIFMPNKTGVVYSPKARRYFHPPGCKDPRLSQPPSVFQIAGTSQVFQIYVVTVNIIFVEI